METSVEVCVLLLHVHIETSYRSLFMQTLIITASTTPSPSNTPTGRNNDVTQTPVISDAESSTDDGGVPVAVFAGVGGMMVVIIALTLLVILVVVLVRKNRSWKDG